MTFKTLSVKDLTKRKFNVVKANLGLDTDTLINRLLNSNEEIKNILERNFNVVEE